MNHKKTVLYNICILHLEKNIPNINEGDEVWALQKNLIHCKLLNVPVGHLWNSFIGD